jgi:hypothetical protein
MPVPGQCVGGEGEEEERAVHHLASASACPCAAEAAAATSAARRHRSGLFGIVQGHASLLHWERAGGLTAQHYAMALLKAANRQVAKANAAHTPVAPAVRGRIARPRLSSAANARVLLSAPSCRPALLRRTTVATRVAAAESTMTAPGQHLEQVSGGPVTAAGRAAIAAPAATGSGARQWAGPMLPRPLGCLGMMLRRRCLAPRRTARAAFEPDASADN